MKKIPGDKKVYAVIAEYGVEYAAHITERELNWRKKYGGIRAISKREYQELRENGVPSWGENQLRLAKMCR